jgi:hypothetical protein
LDTGSNVIHTTVRHEVEIIIVAEGVSHEHVGIFGVGENRALEHRSRGTLRKGATEVVSRRHLTTAFGRDAASAPHPSKVSFTAANAQQGMTAPPPKRLFWLSRTTIACQQDIACASVSAWACRPRKAGDAAGLTSAAASERRGAKMLALEVEALARPRALRDFDRLERLDPSEQRSR